MQLKIKYFLFRDCKNFKNIKFINIYNYDIMLQKGKHIKFLL